MEHLKRYHYEVSEFTISMFLSTHKGVNYKRVVNVTTQTCNSSLDPSNSRVIILRFLKLHNIQPFDFTKIGIYE